MEGLLRFGHLCEQNKGVQSPGEEQFSRQTGLSFWVSWLIVSRQKYQKDLVVSKTENWHPFNRLRCPIHVEAKYGQ
jgi:hypothetical protein